MDPSTKLAKVRAAMVRGDWEEAINIAGKFQNLGTHSQAIRRARDAQINPAFYEQLGYDIKQLRRAGIAALKERYSSSWNAVRRKVSKKGKR